MQIKKPFYKINFEDIDIASEFFDHNQKHLSEFIMATIAYYSGKNVEIKSKLVEKYFKTYKKTMDSVILAKESGIKGAILKAESQTDKSTTLEGVLKDSLADTLPTNNKLLNINNKQETVKDKKENTEEEKPIGLPLAKPTAKPTKKLIVNEDVNEIITDIDNLFDSKYLSEKTKSTLTLLLSSYKKEQIINAIKWAKSDNFWNAQFLSPAKLNTKNKDGVLYIDVFLAGYEKNKPVEYVKKEFVSNNPYLALCDSQPTLTDKLKQQQYEF